MEFTLTTNNCLTKFFRLFNFPSRILFTHSIKNGHHLFSFGFIDSLDSTRKFRIGILNEIKAIITILTVQCIACVNIFQFHSTTYITGYELVHLDSGSTCTSIKLGDSFFGTTICICQIVSFVYLSAHHLKILHLTNMMFNSSFKEIERRRAISIRNYAFSTSIMQRRHFVYKRNYISQELHQTTNSHILTCTNTENREHTPCS